ncbi:MAG: hypothetical protein EB021_04655 [Gammaproteobacteria bacterium]|jgi:uncharacterized membrane protein|nr:hypothetical protein [Gammaproteobacteria bacterium]NBR18168.1 hypothetical protein [Gammaproteobacteria bacterium]NDB15669.1 hypothetical protein [Gammaproteobacteria bacterium]NDB24722.1 hypothetical protein [Gammaproteobacteria bacterium]NDE87304.1 hypothetical protein [Gammaproteobacteria bacterium]
MQIERWIKNLFATPLLTRRRFPNHVRQAIEKAVATVESRHAGEIRFVIETALDFSQLRAGCTPRERALDLFGALGVWDTADNNGVLIYVLMAEHDVEIIADRGIAAKVDAAEWQTLCAVMESHFRDGRFREGALAGIEGVGDLLARHFPNAPGDRNEQPNRPVLL